MSGEQVRQGHQMGFLDRAYQGTSHDADALILTCIDFRFPHQIVDYMDSLSASRKAPDHIRSRDPRWSLTWRFQRCVSSVGDNVLGTTSPSP